MDIFPKYHFNMVIHKCAIHTDIQRHKHIHTQKMHTQTHTQIPTHAHSHTHTNTTPTSTYTYSKCSYIVYITGFRQNQEKGLFFLINIRENLEKSKKSGKTCEVSI